MATRTTTKAPSGDRQVARKAGFTKGGANPPARREDAAANTRSRLLPEERRRLIAETAYFIAERREDPWMGFPASASLVLPPLGGVILLPR